MNDLFEQTEVVNDIQHNIWVERYRPVTLDNYICEPYLKKVLEGFIDKKDIPHLMFYNVEPGTGKCLDGSEYIDIQMDVTADEYEILKNYELFE